MSRYWSMPTSIVATRHRHGRIRSPRWPAAILVTPQPCLRKYCPVKKSHWRSASLLTASQCLLPGGTGRSDEQSWHCRMPSATESSSCSALRLRVSYSESKALAVMAADLVSASTQTESPPSRADSGQCKPVLPTHSRRCARWSRAAVCKSWPGSVRQRPDALASSLWPKRFAAPT